jgi:soluble cytochrome b562
MEDFIITNDGIEEVLRQIKEEMKKVLKSTKNAATKEDYDELKNKLSDLETQVAQEKEVQLCFSYL